MKVAALLLMAAGWFIAIAAVVLLTELAIRTAFALAGLGIQALGFVLLAVQFRAMRGERH